VGRLIGAFYFDSRPIHAEGQAWARAFLGAGDPDAAHVDLAPGLLMGCAASPLDRPKDNERFVSRDGDVCMWDGRLDNREDLVLQLGKDLPEASTDSALALRLYQARGVDGFRDLIGDWSLAIWDAKTRTVVLASDYAGIRPLYYHHALDRLLWCSSLSGLVDGTGSRILDEEYVAGFLIHGHAALRTPYRDVFPVPPGHAVCVSQRRIATQAFWSLPVDQTITYQDERCYEERLRTLFREAVSVRLRTDSPVCAELSGGLDSSSVVCMASHIAAARPAAQSDLVTFSYTHKDCPDERYFRVVERELNLSGVHFDLEEVPFVAANQAGNAAPGWWEPRFAELARQMNRIGSAVLLTGQLGDFTMGNSPDDSDQVVDYLDQGHYVRAAREAFAWSQSQQVPIYPILWRALRTKYRSWTASAVPDGAAGVGRYAGVDSFAPGFRGRFASGHPDRPGELGWRAAAPGRRRRFRALSDMLWARNLQVPETLEHISYTHPFAHRPLVEFMLTIPPAVTCRPGEPRRLMRRAFAGLLPPSILKRQSKAAYSAVYRQSLLPLAAEVLRDTAKMRSVELGFIERDSVTERLQAFTHGLDCNESQLRQIILFEFWLRNRWESGRSVPPRANRLAVETKNSISSQVALST
jgi:asparagine synthase (glutamine-hydrolysing)